MDLLVLEEVENTKPVEQVENTTQLEIKKENTKIQVELIVQEVVQDQELELEVPEVPQLVLVAGIARGPVLRLPLRKRGRTLESGEWY